MPPRYAIMQGRAYLGEQIALISRFAPTGAYTHTRLRGDSDEKGKMPPGMQGRAYLGEQLALIGRFTPDRSVSTYATEGWFWLEGQDAPQISPFSRQTPRADELQQQLHPAHPQP